MKKVLFLFLALLLFLSLLSVSAFADHKDSTGWKVDFTGNEMICNFSSSVFDDLFMSIEPGDDALISISIKNSSSDDTMWYMHNEAIQSLEDSIKSANGGLYTYKLTYVAPSGKVTTLFDSDHVGGETNSVPEGLNQISDKMKDYFYLDTLTGGQSGKVNLYVALEGETQGNAYQNTLARLEAQFAVEKVPKEETVIHKSVRVPYSTRPKTGDDSGLFVFISAAAASLLGLVSALSLKRRKSAVLVLVFCMVFALTLPVSEAAADSDYNYLISVYSGNIGSFAEGNVKKTSYAPGQVVNLGDIEDLVQLPANSKYYIKGIRLSGRDNSEELTNMAFAAKEDALYRVAYGVKGNITNYTVNYVDSNGKILSPAKTLIGNVGDKPVVAYKYIDGYQPNTHNLTKTLVEDSSKNVFTFTYTAITPQQVTVTQTDTVYEGTYEVNNTTTTADANNNTTTTADANNTEATNTDGNETADNAAGENTAENNTLAENSTAEDNNVQDTQPVVPQEDPFQAAAPTAVPVQEPVVQDVAPEQVPLAPPEEIIDLDPAENGGLFDIPELAVPLAQLQLRADEGDEAARTALILKYCGIGLLSLLALLVIFFVILILRRKSRTRNLIVAGESIRSADVYDDYRQNDKNVVHTESAEDFDVEKLFNRKDL